MTQLGITRRGRLWYHDVRATEMASVTLLTPAEATLRFGPRYPGGVLLVRTHRATTTGRCPAS